MKFRAQITISPSRVAAVSPPVFGGVLLCRGAERQIGIVTPGRDNSARLRLQDRKAGERGGGRPSSPPAPSAVVVHRHRRAVFPLSIFSFSTRREKKWKTGNPRRYWVFGQFFHFTALSTAKLRSYNHDNERDNTSVMNAFFYLYSYFSAEIIYINWKKWRSVVVLYINAVSDWK